MDKQKDFIHIDDVFRDLGLGEEKEKSGSWLQMKALLDKELPLGASVTRPGYRRYLLPIMALLLLGGGAYIHYQSDQTNKQAAISSVNEMSQTTVSSVPAENKPVLQNNKTRASSDHHAAAAQQQIRSGTAKTSPAATKTIKNTTTATTAGKNRPSGQNPGYSHEPASKSRIVAATTPGKENIPSPPKKEQNSQFAFAAKLPENLNDNAMSSKGSGSDDLPEIRENHVIETLKPKPVAGSAKSMAGNQLNNPDLSEEKEWEPLATWNGSTIVKSKDNFLYKEERDTFTSMTINRKLPAKPGPGYRDRIQLDTVSISRIESIRYIPLSRSERDELIHARLLPADYWAALNPDAALASRDMTEQVNMVPLAQYKVSSKKAKTNTIGALKNTATGLTSVFDGTKKWYAALLLGGNTSIGSPGAYGMQFGIAALFAVAERWTLSAELKYQNGYYSNFQFLDKSSTFDVNEQQYGSGWLYQGKEYRTNSNYTIKSKASLSMPLLLSYNLGRVSIFGGPEFTYFYPLAWTNGKYTETINVSQTSVTHKSPFENSPLLLDEKTDFDSRFGMGYVLGLSYDFSRKVSLDARVSQMLWDNSGKYKMDALRNVYRLPTAELSIGFYFGRRDKVIYIMDRKK